ncbi:hypothetical protein GW17_00004084 [Ensete ventricosum]|nr:hypothetical protein GW17_00004084 [Ensete ventricosum]
MATDRWPWRRWSDGSSGTPASSSAASASAPPASATYYGGTVSETVLGNCLHELNVPREEIVVSNKCGRYIDGFDFSAERMTRSIDESLARLKLDYVDILHCHDIEFGSLDQVFINDSALVDLLPYLKSKGVGVISASPLAMCLLTDNGPPEWHPASLEFKILFILQVEENVASALGLSSLGIDQELLHEVEIILEPVKNQTWPSGIQR